MSNTQNYTKFLSKEAAEKQRKWKIVDAAGLTVGRLASEVACILRGKNKANFTPHVDNGDFVVVVNASKIRFTAGKEDKKEYISHSQYIGGTKRILAGDLLKKNPRRVIELAVQGMLPKGALGRRLILKLKIYPDAEHPHAAQNPEVYKPLYTKAA